MDELIYSKRRNYQLYPESLKIEVVRAYETSDCSLSFLQRKYEIGSSVIIRHWLKKYRNNAYIAPLNKPLKTAGNMQDSPEIEKLKRRILQLERELEDAKLLSEAYSLMIKKAEEELKIPIRKKLNTK